MSDVPALGLAAVDVIFARSPVYLAETLADAVDARMLGVRDEPRFWRQLTRKYDLFASELPQIRARVAAKYCRNLDLWRALPALRGEFRLYLLHTGLADILERWRAEYTLDSVFDGIVSGCDGGLLARDPELYQRFATAAGQPISSCTVVEPTLAGIEAAHKAGAQTYRYGTLYGFRRWQELPEADRHAGVSVAPAGVR